MKNARRGFTLVEVIVVLVILAILAAIVMPAMTGWIDKAKEKRLLVPCRTCVNAAQTLVAENYGMTGTITRPSSGDILALARTGGSVTGVDFVSDTAQIGHLGYSDGTDSILYCASAPGCHPEHYNYGVNWSSSLSTDAAAIHNNVNSLLDFANSITVGNSTGIGNGIDSSANTDEGHESKKLQAMMNHADWAALQAGLQNLNIKDWSLQKEGGTPIAWITTEDLSQHQPGDFVRVIRYNTKLGTYTAGYLQVERDDGVIKFERIGNLATPEDNAKWREQGGQTGTTKADPGKTAEIFNEMDATWTP